MSDAVRDLLDLPSSFAAEGKQVRRALALVAPGSSHDIQADKAAVRLSLVHDQVRQADTVW
jgi:hypothetical protein